MPLNVFSKSVQFAEQLWRRPRRSLTMLQPGGRSEAHRQVFLSVWSNFLPTAATMQPSALQQKNFPLLQWKNACQTWVFFTRQVKLKLMYSHNCTSNQLVISSGKKSFIEEFWMSTSQFSICKITIQLCASFKTSICSWRADVP